MARPRRARDRLPAVGKSGAGHRLRRAVAGAQPRPGLACAGGAACRAPAARPGDPPRRRALCVEPDLDIVADDTHRIGLEVVADRRAEALAGLHLEPSAMQRAFDDLAVEPALGQLGVGVGAEVVGGVDFAVDVVERDLALY